MFTPWSSILFEKRRAIQLFKKYSAFYGPTTPLVSILSQINPSNALYSISLR
jgi:hypothetical protein